MLTNEHAKLLQDSGISAGVYEGRTESVDGALVFTWVSPDGRETLQKRSDDPNEDRRYKWAPGVEMPLGVPQGMQSRVLDPETKLVIVEGTKQHMAAATAALASTGSRCAVIGVAGCYGYFQDGAPISDLYKVPMSGRDVVIAFDADRLSNLHVYNAGSRLKGILEDELGARSVKFANLPGSAKDGFDDVLARAAEPSTVFDRIVGKAGPEGKKPAAPERDFFDKRGNLKALTLHRAILAAHPLAVTEEGTIAVYQDGRYQNGSSRAFNSTVTRLLGEDFRTQWLATATEIATTDAISAGRRIDTYTDKLLINVTNGLLDPVTLELHPHSPDFLSTVQFPISWDPEATCPRFDQWVNRQAPGRRGIILDAASQALDPTRTPSKALFLYGPSRTGKSTLGRVMQEIIGGDNTSAVTLHELTDNKFAAANLLGKTLNLSMDLSSKEASDLSMFKKLTGSDRISADRKYGQRFDFTNKALFLWSANEIPQTTETSKAFTTRVVPVHFNKTFIGEEDDTIESDILGRELPGVFRALVLALRDHLARGSYLDPIQSDSEGFKVGTDRVAQFLAECTLPSTAPVGTGRVSLYSRYVVWSESNQAKPLGRNRFRDSMVSNNVGEFRKAREGRCYEVITRDIEDEDPVDDFNTDPQEEAPMTDDTLTPDSHSPNGTESANSSVSVHRDFSKRGVKVSFPHKQSAKTVIPAPETVTDDTLAATHKPVETFPRDHSDRLELDQALIFDLETQSADLLHHGLSDFIRLTVTDQAAAGEASVFDLYDATATVGFNSLQFDMQAIYSPSEILDATELGLHTDLRALAPTVWPIEGGLPTGASARSLSLDALTRAHTDVDGKDGDLGALASEFGGFGEIPVTDERYLAYAQGDIVATKALLGAMDLDTQYSFDEMRYLGRLAAGVQGVGLKVDPELLESRIQAEKAQAAEGLRVLVEEYGMDSLKADGTRSDNPLRTNKGKDTAFEAFAAHGVTDFPKTKSGAKSLGSDFMRTILAGTPNDSLRALAQAVLSLQGKRSIFETIRDNVAPDGRTHSSVFPGQASGRLSLTDPGLTVTKGSERDVFVPDAGQAFVAFDLSNIDSRSIAAHSQDAAFIQTLSLEVNPRTGATWDGHVESAWRLWGSTDPAMRKQAKQISHSYAYGAGSKSIAKTTGLPLRSVIEYMSFMRTEYPILHDWKKATQELARGSELDNGFGRRLRVSPDRISTTAVAQIGQSCSRDALRQGVLNLPRRLAERIRVTVHDEIVLSLDVATIQDDIAEVLASMRFDLLFKEGDIPVPVYATASPIGWNNWAECYA